MLAGRQALWPASSIAVVVITAYSRVHIVSRVLRTVVLLHEAEQLKTEKNKIDDARKKYDRAWTELQKLPEELAGCKRQDRGFSRKPSAAA